MVYGLEEIAEHRFFQTMRANWKRITRRFAGSNFTETPA